MLRNWQHCSILRIIATDALFDIIVESQRLPEAQKKLAYKIARVLLPDAPNFEK